MAAPLFFKTPGDFRKWLHQNHAGADQLLVGFYKKGSGKPSMTWPESVDQALCFGWIDGVRRNAGEDSYTIRFTPRRPGSTWSTININKVKVLTVQGLMQPAGIRAYEGRTEKNSGIYAYEQDCAELEGPYLARLKKNVGAWKFFQAQPPGYRKQMSHRIMTAKQEATRNRRLEQLIAASAEGRRL
jgi:uncharacterized protein YdeI (YjbR/CyaY-like superfamily)